MTRKNRKGFTLIELLVVVLILAILMAVALPLYLSAVADSERKTCRANMQTIATAVQAWRVANRNSTGLPAMTALNPDLQGQPQCPSDATSGDVDYQLNDLGVGSYSVGCLDVGAHGTFTPGVDSQ
jgi:type IV pilus assembly protein PilA